MKRKIYDRLLSWKRGSNKKPLMIKGARQVGKTYIVREFGSNEYDSFVELNFILNPEYKDIFDGTLSAEEIYKRLSAQVRGVKLIPNNTLIFLDEIQNCGNARTAIKFLAEDGRFDIISSGSLLGLTYAENGDKDAQVPASVPTGYEEFITMFPMDFEEYLWAEGYNADAIELLEDYYQSANTIPSAINNKYLQLFREFIVVGGMPEVVKAYVANHDFNEVTKVQKQILDNYRFDISKHAKGAEKIKVQACYEAIPKQLAKEIKKFQYSTVEKKTTSKKYGGSIKWLIDSSLVNPCYNVSTPNIPLLAYAKQEQFKLYINDTGLLCEMYGFETKRAILKGTIQGFFKGGIYENAIACELLKNGFDLYYYKPNDSRELEFLIEKRGDVIPIEVKAGNNSTKSLNEFIEEYSPNIGYKFISGNIGFTERKLSLPHYMIIFIMPDHSIY